MTSEAEERLRAAGMAAGPAARQATRFAEVQASLRDLSGPPPRAGNAMGYWVPGRIEVLGKHTDYAGGRSLLCAVERGICMAAIPSGDSRLRILDALSMELVECEMHPDITGPARQWGSYPATVARRMLRDFPTLGSPRGADIVFASDLPRASGMSSSSALIVATFLALSDANDLRSLPEFTRHIRDDLQLAGYLGAVENGWSFESLAGDTGVGTLGGSEDHTAILCGRADALVQYSFRPVRFERSTALPGGYCFVIGVSGVRAEKTGAARESYNRASRAVSAMESSWRDATGRDESTLAALLSSSPDAPGRLRTLLGGAGGAGFTASELLTRLEHFIVESEEIVPAATEALARGDIEEFGAVVDRSQRGAERLLGNQIDETIALAHSARDLGAAAASAFGAGFGGSVWAMVRSNEAEEFLRRWEEHYRQRFSDGAAAGEAAFFATGAGPRAMRIHEGAQ